jgi:hypothetical protein
MRLGLEKKLFIGTKGYPRITAAIIDKMLK